MVIQNEKRDRHFHQILALLTIEKRIHSRGNQIFQLRKLDY